MVRKQVYIERRQDVALARRARQLRLPKSEIVRRGIDLVIRHTGVGPVDRAAWQSELAFIRKRAMIAARRAVRSWTRDELYRGSG
jgi:hypothetical protein